MKILLEELKKVNGDSTEFLRGFNTAINILIALNNSDDNHIKDLEREVAQLRLRVTQLEINKQPARWYPYVTYCDDSGNNNYTTGTKTIQ